MPEEEIQKVSMKWKLYKQIFMLTERFSMFFSGVFVGGSFILGKIALNAFTIIGLTLMIIAAIAHFMEYEADYKMSCHIVKEHSGG